MKNPNCRTLKKLYKIMINDCMLNNHLQTLGNFLPYMISDHSPVVITFPNGDQKKKRAFRFSNFITNKEEFIETVKKEWNKEVQGHKMYVLVQKMKSLKVPLRQLSWKNGDV